MTRSKAAFQGEFGSNSHELCMARFPDYAPHPCATFADAFAAVRSGECRIGVIAMENSIVGRVTDVHHLLPRSRLRIVGERFMPIRLHLMANPGVAVGDLRVVSSHVMALGQCRGLIGRLGLRTEVAADTAGAARELAEAPDPHRGVVASALAAQLHGLAILERNVEDDPRNTTRFLVMTADAHPPEPPAGAACLTSLMFRARNVPAALYKALGGFSSNGVNLVKLESYVEGDQLAAASFYAEIEGRPADPAVALALEELAFFSRSVEVLGVYEADPHRARAPGAYEPADAGLARVTPQEAPEDDEDGAAERPWADVLAHLRHSIDNVDAALVHLLAERFKCTRRVGQLKARHGLPSTDPGRETRQIERLRGLARSADLDPAFAEKFLAFVIAEVIRHHDAQPR